MKNQSHLAREIIETTALTLLIFFVVQLTVQNYRVDGISMEPGLNSNENVFVNKLAYLFHGPERGDVIVFHWPLDTSRNFIKRVIGLPGDIITTDSTTVRVNDIAINEPYISEQWNPAAIRRVVPPNDYFVMGDNRHFSDDSRDWGFVPKNYIIGKAVMVYWPVSDWQLINTYPAVFAQIKPDQ